MATLTVLEFPTAEGAQTMLSTLENLQKQQLIQIEDGAIITWPAGARKPKTEQLRSMTGAGALGGAFWGMLAGEAAIFTCFFFTKISFLWYNVIGCLVVIATAIAVTAVRRPSAPASGV